MNKLKKWPVHRNEIFIAESSPIRLNHPKGILLIYAQGGNKSLTAKGIAGVCSLLLLRLDIGRQFNKFIGETETNLLDAIKIAETISPYMD